MPAWDELKKEVIAGLSEPTRLLTVAAPMLLMRCMKSCKAKTVISREGIARRSGAMCPGALYDRQVLTK